MHNLWDLDLLTNNEVHLKKTTENVVDPLIQPKTILIEKDVSSTTLRKDLTECNLDELKCCLEYRGQKKGGRKTELIARMGGLLKVNLLIDSKVDNGM